MTFTEILAESRRLTKTSGNTTSYSADDITVSANRALDRITAIIRDSEGRWQWDDTNYTDFPFATTALVADQQDYSLATPHHKIERVELKDSSGAWNKLVPIDQADLFDSSITDFLKTSGTPKYYDKIGTSVLLYPKPSYSQAASLKVFHERGASYFTSSDTTKQPGFISTFHSLVPMWCAYDYALLNLSASFTKGLREEIALWEDWLKGYYAKRDKDEKITLSAKGARYKFN